MYGFTFDCVDADQTISFDYVHTLSIPQVNPPPVRIRSHPPIVVQADVVLRFGMMEGTAVVTAERCVYDPQSAFAPEKFAANGSSTAHLAIVGNRGEIAAMGGDPDQTAAARNLLRAGAEVVIIKSGPLGAVVVQASGVNEVPAYQTNRVWKLGSGDVFAALFAARWGVHGDPVTEAARLASKAVAEYAESMSLPVPTEQELRTANRPEAKALAGRVYIAGPFFTLAQRWLVDEARRCLREMGLDVLSPLHDIGLGPGSVVAPADLAGLQGCEVVFALVDGIDSGTIFEIGYARARGMPVYALAQNTSDQDLKMIEGSGCKVFDDFVTAIHHCAWRA